MDSNNRNRKKILQAFVESMLFTALLALYAIVMFAQHYSNLSGWRLFFIISLAAISTYAAALNLSFLKIQKLAGYLSVDEWKNLTLNVKEETKPPPKKPEKTEDQESYFSFFALFDFIGLFFYGLFFTLKQIVAILILQNRLQAWPPDINEKNASAWGLIFIFCVWAVHPYARRAFYALSAGLLLFIAQSCGLTSSYAKLAGYLLCGYGLVEAYQALKNL